MKWFVLFVVLFVVNILLFSGGNGSDLKKYEKFKASYVKECATALNEGEKAKSDKPSADKAKTKSKSTKHKAICKCMVKVFEREGAIGPTKNLVENSLATVNFSKDRKNKALVESCL